MNEKVNFAINVLKQYAEERGEMIRGTTDLSPLEEWLIMKLFKAEFNAKTLQIYAKAINQIDDLFEYRYQKLDKEEIKIAVMTYIDNITKQLSDKSA